MDKDEESSYFKQRSIKWVFLGLYPDHSKLPISPLDIIFLKEWSETGQKETEPQTLKNLMDYWVAYDDKLKIAKVLDNPKFFNYHSILERFGEVSKENTNLVSSNLANIQSNKSLKNIILNSN